MSNFVLFAIEHYQPICGLVLGIIMILVAFVISYGKSGAKTTNWIKWSFYRNSLQSDFYTKELIKGVGTYLALLGVALVILAIYFLQNVK